MSLILKKLVDQYLEDITPRPNESAASMQAKAKRIASTYPKIYKQIVIDLENSGGGGNIEGGSANTIYLQTQVINGGNAI